MFLAEPVPRGAGWFQHSAHQAQDYQNSISSLSEGIAGSVLRQVLRLHTASARSRVTGVLCQAGTLPGIPVFAEALRMP